MLEMLLSAWTMNKADFVGWVLEPTQEVVALSTSASAWLTSDPPYLATKRNLVKPNIDPACFVAGTLVHTKEGLRPIEEIKVGDWVLSKPENGEGKQAYKRVTQTFVHDDKEVCLLSYVKSEGYGWRPDSKTWESRLIVTLNHPFFVKGHEYNEAGNRVPTIGWVEAGQLKTDHFFVTTDDAVDTFVSSHAVLRATEVEKEMAWILVDRDDLLGNYIDFRTYPFLIRAELCDDDYANAYEGGSAVRSVFNIEVEDYHTYYVGAIGPNNAGALVHNKNNADIAAVQEVAKNGLFVTGGVPVYVSSPRRLG